MKTPRPKKTVRLDLTKEQALVIGSMLLGFWAQRMAEDIWTSVHAREQDGPPRTRRKRQ